LDIKNLTKEAAIDIYYKDFWLPMNLTKILENELVLQVFDMGVTSGIRTSIRILQRLVGVTDDGFIGNITLRAIREYNGDVVADFIKRRKLFYIVLVQKHPEKRRFLKGWLNRIDNTKF
jgi:lysozyme family protein